MWTLLGIIFVSFNLIEAQINEGFLRPGLLDNFFFGNIEGLDSTCEEHINQLVKGLRGRKIWALRMFDSMAKFPDGILVGHLKSPGFFDECVNVENDKFTGKHCMPKLTLTLERRNKFLVPRLRNDYQTSLKEKTEVKIPFTFGICVPSTCNSTDVVHLFQKIQSNVELLKDFKIEITEEDCSTKGFRPFRPEDWAALAVLVVLVVLALFSTLYDLTERFFNKNETPSKLWSSFSIYSNGKYLFTISQSTEQLHCLHGIRCISMLWVILGHTYFSVLLGPVYNAFETADIMDDKTFIPISNGFLSVDSFFFLSGLLVCLVFFRDITKKKTFDVPVAFIHRYMRLTPPFALLMLIQATILSRIGNGPFWNTAMDSAEKQCRDSWWAGILYVQNYLKPQSMCLGQAWYLSADMQMFWLSPLILYPLLWFPTFGPYFLTILIVAAASTNFAIGYVNGLAPNFLMNFGIQTLKQLELDYVTFHTRMAPWLIGLTTGYIISGIYAKKIQITLSKTWVIVGWTASLLLLSGSFLGILRFVSKTPNEYSQVESSLYLALHRVGWALGLGWAVIACVAGYGGPINTLLSIGIFQILGKLSYCTFLVHLSIQNYRVFSSRTNHYLRHFDIVYSYFGDIVIAHLISVPAFLLFEIPFSNLDRHFLQKLVIFPLPRPVKEKKSAERDQEPEKASPLGQKAEPSSEDVEKGKVNPAFNET